MTDHEQSRLTPLTLEDAGTLNGGIDPTGNWWDGVRVDVWWEMLRTAIGDR